KHAPRGGEIALTDDVAPRLRAVDVPLDELELDEPPDDDHERHQHDEHEPAIAPTKFAHVRALQENAHGRLAILMPLRWQSEPVVARGAGDARAGTRTGNRARSPPRAAEPRPRARPGAGCRFRIQPRGRAPGRLPRSRTRSRATLGSTKSGR